jgi:hypothetical protein
MIVVATFERGGGRHDDVTDAGRYGELDSDRLTDEPGIFVEVGEIFKRAVERVTRHFLHAGSQRPTKRSFAAREAGVGGLEGPGEAAERAQRLLVAAEEQVP